MAGPYHASINYPQYDYLGYIPNQPFAVYTDTNPDDLSSNDIMSFLPDSDATLGQLDIAQLLGVFRFDIFGNYSAYENLLSSDQAANIATFQAALQDVTAVITQRNTHRSVPYVYLLPENIPNSASV